MKERPDTSCSCPWSVFVTLYVSRFHSFIVRSVDADARTLPLELNARKVTIPAWDFRVCSCSPYSKSHSLMLASSLDEATML